MSVLPFDQRDGFIWLNGQLLPWADARLHVLSHGLHYGSCVFEGERAYEGRIFKSREHTERFHNSAQILDFEIPYSVDEIETAKALVLQKNGWTSCYVRPVAWRGSEMMAVAVACGRCRG
jgi:branched-chain amino acid aminotransferase